MLILQRSFGEKINIGDDIEILVTRVSINERLLTEIFALKNYIYASDFEGASKQLKKVLRMHKYSINVGIGIDAPSDVKIWRNEIYNNIKSELAQNHSLHQSFLQGEVT